MRHFILILLTLAITGCGVVTEETIAIEQPIQTCDTQLIIAGDSIAIRFGSIYNESMGVKSVTTAISGQTAMELKADLQNQIFRFTPELVILNIGVNPVLDSNTTPSIQDIIFECELRGIDLIINTVPYIYNETYKTQRINEVNEWIRLNFEHSHIIVDMSELIPRECTKDDLHPNDAGYKNMYDKYMEIIQ